MDISLFPETVNLPSSFSSNIWRTSPLPLYTTELISVLSSALAKCNLRALALATSLGSTLSAELLDTHSTECIAISLVSTPLTTPLTITGNFAIASSDMLFNASWDRASPSVPLRDILTGSPLLTDFILWMSIEFSFIELERLNFFCTTLPSSTVTSISWYSIDIKAPDWEASSWWDLPSPLSSKISISLLGIVLAFFSLASEVFVVLPSLVISPSKTGDKWASALEGLWASYTASTTAWLYVKVIKGSAVRFTI